MSLNFQGARRRRYKPILNRLLFPTIRRALFLTSHQYFLAIFISSYLPQVSQLKEEESDVEENYFPGSPAGSSGTPGHFSSTPVHSDLNSKKVNTTFPILQTGELRPRVK